MENWRISVDDLRLARESIFMTYLLDIVEKYRKLPIMAPEPLKTFKEAQFQRLMDLITNDLVGYRGLLKTDGIKIVDIGQREMLVDFEIYKGGFKEKFSMVKDFVRAELQVRLTDFVKDVMKETREGKFVDKSKSR